MANNKELVQQQYAFMTPSAEFDQLNELFKEFTESLFSDFRVLGSSWSLVPNTISEFNPKYKDIVLKAEVAPSGFQDSRGNEKMQIKITFFNYRVMFLPLDYKCVEHFSLKTGDLLDITTLVDYQITNGEKTARRSFISPLI